MKFDFCTVVFNVKDQEAFREFASKFIQSMSDESLVGGAVVTGFGWDDSMTTADKYEELLRDHGIDPDDAFEEEAR